MLEGLFGNQTVEKILWFLFQYQEGYTKEIALAFELPVTTVKNSIKRLEQGNIIVAKTVGRTKLYRINPRWPFKEELCLLLKKSLEALPPSEIERLFTKRTRPRRSGKPI